LNGIARHVGLVGTALALVCLLPTGARTAPERAGTGGDDASSGGAMPAKAAACEACHGANVVAQPLYPILAGQTSRYLYLQLRDFQAGRRMDPLMTPMAADLSRDEMRELADFYARRKPPRPKFQPDPEKAAIGKAKASETLCTMCHLGGFAGQNEIPRVAGQNYDYIVKQLKDFKARRRANDGGSMTSVANTMSDEDIDNVAHYLAGL
jgi:cytochrome c553